MNINAIAFPQGAGGNFFVRVLTLDDKTVPMGGYMSGQTYMSVDDRFARYSYNNINFEKEQFNVLGNNNLSKWVDYELNTMFFPISCGIEILVEYDQIIIEGIHPCHYVSKMSLFDDGDTISHYYINDDNMTDWIDRQIKGKIGSNYSYTKDQHIINEYDFKYISLEKIVNSEKTFINEYNRVCDLMEIQSHNKYALEIYKTWKKTWF